MFILPHPVSHASVFKFSFKKILHNTQYLFVSTNVISRINAGIYLVCVVLRLPLLWAMIPLKFRLFTDFIRDM
jgi:hypothetical protein